MPDGIKGQTLMQGLGLDPIAKTLHAEIVRMMKEGASKEDIAEEIQIAREMLDEASANDPERKRTVGAQIGAVAATAGDAATFGGLGFVTAGVEALRGRGSFTENRDAWGDNKDALPAYVSVPAAIAGAVVNPAGAFLGPVVKGAGMGARVLRGAKEGAMQGGASQFGENVGRSGGAKALALRMALGIGVGGAAGGGFGAVGARRALQRANSVLGEETTAAERRLQGTTDADKIHEVPVLPTGPGAPKLIALDIAGPNTREATRKAAQSIPGREAIRPTLEAREAAMPKGLEDAFDHATGTTARDAEALAGDLATLETMRQGANDTQKKAYDALVAQLKQAHSDAVRAAAVKPTPVSLTEGLDVLADEGGGEIPDAIGVLRRTREGKMGRAAADYPAAIDATKGTPVEMDEGMQAAMKSPTVQAAWKAVQRNRADVVARDPSRALPEVEVGTGKPQGFQPTSLGPGAVVQKAETEAVPDAEALHEIKRYLQDAAKLRPNETTPEGIQAIHANNALELLDPVMASQNQAFRAADAPYSASSRQEEAIKLGMTPARANPAPSKALTRSLGAVERRVGELPQSEAELFRVGKQFDIASRLRRGLSPARAAQLLDEPTSDLSREVTLAYGEGAPSRIAQRLRTPDPTPKVGPFVKPPAPSKILPDAPTQATIEGLGIRNTPTIPSPNAPARSLVALKDRLPSMSIGEAKGLQQGAAAGHRQVLTSGSKLDLGVPERARQFSFAAQSPQKAGYMAKIEQAWDDLLDRQRAVLGNRAELPVEPLSIAQAGERSISASWPYTAARFARNVLTSPMTKSSIEREGLTDAAFNRVMGDDPEAIQRALRQLAEIEGSMSSQASKAAALGGRIGGSIW